MMVLTQSKRAILGELYHGPLGPAAIAEATGYPPYLVHGDLKSMKRERLVLERLTTRVHEWELSDRGYLQLNNEQQTELAL